MKNNNPNPSVANSSVASSARTDAIKSSVAAEAHALYMNGVIGELNGDLDQSISNFAHALKLDPANQELALEVSSRLIHGKKYEEALDVLTRATSLPNATSQLFAKLGEVYLQLGREADAELACQSAIKLSFVEIDPYRTLFLLRIRKGHPTEALGILNQARKATGFSDEDNLELGELYIALNKFSPSQSTVIKSNGLTVLDRELAANLDDPRFRLRLGDDFLQLEAPDKARTILTSLLETMDDIPALKMQARERLVRIYIQQGDQKKAEVQLKAVIQDDPSSFSSYYLLGKIADEQHRIEEALSYYGTAAALGGTTNPEYYFDLARVQIDAKKPDEALVTLQKLKAKFQAGFAAEVLTAIAYQRKEDYTNAVMHFTAAEVIGKANEPARLNAGFYFDEGSAYERAGNLDQAEACLLKSLDMDPENAETMNYLGYMWADKGVKLEKAKDMIEKALKLEPDNAAYLDSLGWVFYKLDKAPEALKYIQKSIALSKEPDPTLLEHLGDVFVKLKQTAEAKEAWKKSLKLEPNPAIQKKLDSLGTKP